MSPKLKMIPLSRLTPSAANVRKTDKRADIDSLAANIAAVGLLENLVVQPAGRKAQDQFEVIAGGRRLAALKLLAKRKAIAPDTPIACLVKPKDGDGALAVSLAENFVRLPLHPADQFEAFATLHGGGLPADDIAARFGVTPTFVLQRLKLAAVSPRLIAEYRKETMTLDQLTAFTVSDDHALQEQVWFESGYVGLSGQTIRRLLTRAQVEGQDRRARFVGREAYEAAGGVIVRDLFDSENDGYFTDSQLLDRLVAEKLTEAANAVRSEGWKWIEISSDLDAMRSDRFGRANPTETVLSKAEEKKLSALGARYDALVAALEEQEDDAAVRELDQVEAEIARLQEKKETWPEEERVRAGVVVGIGADGALKVIRGLVKPEDLKQTSAENGNREPVTPHPKSNGYGDGVVLELSAQKTIALREALAGRPDIALVALLHSLAGKLFFGCSTTSCLDISAREVRLDAASPSIGESKAAKAFQKRHDAWVKKMPDKDHLWDWLAKHDVSEQLALLAHCVAMTINALDTPNASSERHSGADKLAQIVDLDMAAWWRPTRENFFGRVTKEHIMASVTEGASPQAAQHLNGLKKDSMAMKAEALLAPTTWLPHQLRRVMVPQS